MAHQLTFYLNQTDSRNLEAIIAEAGSYLILHKRSLTHIPRQVSSTEIQEDGKTWLYYCLVRPEDLEGVKMDYVSAQGYWVIDALRSPVIEYDRCYTDEHLVRRGRMRYATRFYDEGDVVRLKSLTCLRWVNKLFRLMRKTWKREGRDYVGPGAEEVLSKGGTFASS